MRLFCANISVGVKATLQELARLLYLLVPIPSSTSSLSAFPRFSSLLPAWFLANHLTFYHVPALGEAFAFWCFSCRKIFPYTPIHIHLHVCLLSLGSLLKHDPSGRLSLTSLIQVEILQHSLCHFPVWVFLKHFPHSTYQYFTYSICLLLISSQWNQTSCWQWICLFCFCCVIYLLCLLFKSFQ